MEQKDHALTTNGQSSARRPPGEVVSGHVSTLQETGSDVVIKQKLTTEGQSLARGTPAEVVRNPSQPNRYRSISPTRRVKFEDEQELTTEGQSPARGTPTVVREESCGEVPVMVADEDEVEQGRPARTRRPPVGMTRAEMNTHALTHIPFHPG